MQRLRGLITPHHLLAAGLIGVWVIVLAGFPAALPTQLAGWVTYLALLITPGYLLADIVAWRLKPDWIERLALALPFGVAILAIPGTVALLLHLTLAQLAYGWSIASGIVIAAWISHEFFILTRRTPSEDRWTTDQVILAALLGAAFALIVPTLALYKIDGDAYAVNSFLADALAGLPLNAAEPLFGTELGPGVRMIFNQSLTLNYLWAYFSSIDPSTLVATASKSMLALWAIFAAYTLGKAAGGGSRRFGLLTAAIQLLIYVAAPFIRGDNVSLFFFERINADKFMVPVTMLPVVFAMAITFVRTGVWSAWGAAAIATFAVSTIHPLIAAMLALGLGAFGLVHLLMNLRRRTAWLRVTFLGLLIGIVMILPLVQLVLARGEAPLAASYPSSFDGWEVGDREVPVLPFLYMRGLDYYGPMPRMEDLEPSDAYDTDNPFLVWRFALNMDRRRLILFDRDSYISDPSLIMEPPYFLALLLLPMFLWRVRREEGVQFAMALSLAVLFVMFNPLLTPMIGSFVMPWILWRFVWVLPYALVLALAAEQIMAALIRLAGRIHGRYRPNHTSGFTRRLTHWAPLAFVLAATVVLSPGITRNINNLNGRIAFAYEYPTPTAIFDRLNAVTQDVPAVVLADQDLSVTLPAFVANANIVAHRTPTTSEIFPADQQDDALQRLLDQFHFFSSTFLTAEDVATLARYDVDYVITTSGSDLDVQLRLASNWFDWMLDDQSHSLYAVREFPAVDETILGNSSAAAHDWLTAKSHYEAALLADKTNLLARVGLAQIAQRQGQFIDAFNHLQIALEQANLPILYYQLGQLYTQQGRLEEGIAAFDQAQQRAPQVARFHEALGDACLSAGLQQCAASQYETAVSLSDFRDEAGRLIALANLWQERGYVERSLPLYERAAELQPSEYNVFVLVSAYREMGRYADAEEHLRSLRVMYPLSAEAVIAQADLAAAQEDYETAVALLRNAVWLQELQVQGTTNTHLALAQVLLEAGQLEEAADQIAYAIQQNTFNPTGQALLGQLAQTTGDRETAVRAYRRAFELDPSQTGVFVALSSAMRQNGSTPNDVMGLLQTALRLDTDESMLLLALGDQWQRLGNSQEAVDAYLEAIDRLDPYNRIGRRRPNSPTDSRAFAFTRLAGTYEDMGLPEAAMNYYRSAIAAAPEAPWTHLLFGDAQRRRNDVTAAIGAYEEAIARDSSYVDAYVRLADLYEAEGNAERATELYERALELTTQEITAEPLALFDWPVQAADLSAPFGSDETLVRTSLLNPAPPDSAFLRELITSKDHSDVYAAARLYQGRDQSDKAIDLYLQRLAYGESQGWAAAILARYHKELGDLYLVRYELDEATDAYARAVALDNWWPEARLGLAEALTLQDKNDEALEHLRTAVEMAPGSVEAQVALASALDANGRTTEAMTIYVNTARSHPGSGHAALALARAWQDRNRWDLAEQAFREAIDSNPGVADAYVGLAELRMDVGAYDEAQSLLNRATDINFNNVSSYIRLGELAQRRGSVEEALGWYRMAATLPAADQSLNLTLIDSLVRYGDYETALSYTIEALDQRPDDTELLLRLGRIQRVNGRYAEALQTLSTAQVNAPDNSRLYIELAELYLAQGQPDAALNAYEQAITLQPTEASYYVTVSELLARQGEPDLAMDKLLEGLALVPEPATIYETMAALQLQQGRPDHALQTLRDGLDQLGDNTRLFLAMGDYYVNRANFEQVQARYNQALEAQPDIADVHIALGELYLMRSEIENAIAQYQEAIRLDPTTPGHYLSLGNAYETTEQPEEAEKAYRQALVVAPTLVNGYVSLGRLYEAQERWDDAAAIYEEGLEKSPTSGELLSRYAALRFAREDEEGGFALLERAVEVAPTAAAHINRAAVYAELGMIEEARADLEAALDIEPATVEALVALGDLYKNAGDENTAEDFYLRAVEIMPGVPTGYLRLGTMAREAENRDAVVYWNDLARQADPGGLARPADLEAPEQPAETE